MSDVKITSMTPCDCCGPAFPCVTNQGKGGIAALCGFGEFTDVSAPPRYYRSIAANGTGFGCQHIGGCGGNITGGLYGEYQWSGAEDYDAACNYSNTTLMTVYRPVGGTPVCQRGAFLGTFPFLATPGGFTTTITRTSKTNNSFGGCNPIDGIESSGSLSQDLTNEDTEADAIARLMGSFPPPDWGSASTAIWGVRDATAGNSFPYADGRYSIYKAGLKPGRAYRVSVQIKRRPANQTGGYGPFVVAGTVTLEGITDPFGVFSDGPHDLTNMRGFETMADSSCVFTLV